METLIIKTKSVISNPKYGKINELFKGLYLGLDARDIPLSNGSLINQFIAKGSATAENRVLTPIGNYTAPSMSNDGGFPSIKFSGGQGLFQSLSSSNSGGTKTFLFVAKANSLPTATAGTVNRLLSTGFGSTNAFYGISPHYNSLIMATGSDAFPNPSGSTYGERIQIGGENSWFVAVVVFDGTNSRFISNYSNGIVSNTRGENGIPDVGALGLGGNINRTTFPPEELSFQGNIATFLMFNDAKTDAEMMSLYNHYRDEFGI